MSSDVPRPDHTSLLEDTLPNDVDVDRRAVLKTAATTSAVAAGVATASGSGAAEAPEISLRERRRALQGYTAAAGVRAALADHEDLLADLHADGLLDGDTVADLEIDALRTPAPERDGEGEVVEARRIDGEVTPEITVFRHLEEGVLTITVRPERGERRAILNPHAEDAEPETYGESICTDCSRDCCECKLVCCNCCPCSPCSQCFSCTCGMCERCQCDCGGGGWI